MIIDIQSLTKRYKDFAALHNLTLQIEQGEVFGFLGHNGAGKTTTVNILTTLLEPTSGSAAICGYDTTGESMKVRQRIGYLPENVRFHDHLTALENLMFFGKLSGLSNPRPKIFETFEFLDFKGFEHKKMGEFSKGMRQRIGLAQAILHDPEVLFLDEPASGLDPMGIAHLREVIRRINRERGITIFMNTHLLSEIAKTCTTIGVLNHGNLVYKDSLENTLQKFPDDNSLENIYLRKLS